MNKHLLLVIGVCLLSAWLVGHRFKPVAAGPGPQRVLVPQPVCVVTNPDPSVGHPGQAVVLPAGPPSNPVAGVEPVSVPAPADEGDATAALETSRLLRELRALAAKDAEVALAAVLKLPAGEERNQALVAVCLGLGQTDPAAAVQLAKSLHLDELPGAVLDRLVQQWAATDVLSALDWVDRQPVGGQRDGATTRIALVLSQTDPAGAATLVMNQIPSGPAQSEAILTVLNQWAHQDLLAATTWVNGFPAGPLQERAITELEGIVNRQQLSAH